MSAGEILGSIGTALGGGALSIVEWARRKIAAADKNARKAMELATGHEHRIQSLEQRYEGNVGTLKLLLDSHKDDISRQLRRALRSSKPDLTTEEFARRIDLLENEKKSLEEDVAELKAEIVRERGQRHALEKEVREAWTRENGRWADLQRELGETAGMIRRLDRSGR